MADLLEENEWTTGIYQLETSDPVLGGPDGIDNLQAKQLASRTGWLKAQVALLGEGKQPLDATLTALAGLILAGDKLIYATGVDTFATTALSSFIRTLLDDVDAAAARTTLGAAPLESPIFIGNPAAPTPAQFDNDQSLATSAFVKQALGNFSGSAVYAASATLAATDVGKFVLFASPSGGQTLAVPLANSVPAGSAYYIQNGGQAYTLSRSGGDALTVNGGTLTTLPVGTGGQVCAVSDGVSAWYLSGSSTLSNLGDFAASLTSSGYEKLPNGLIRQWGSAGVATASDVTTTLPVAFPNAFFMVAVTQAYTPASGSIGYAGGNPASLGSFTWRGSAVNNGFNFEAIGY